MACMFLGFSSRGSRDLIEDSLGGVGFGLGGMGASGCAGVVSAPAKAGLDRLLPMVVVDVCIDSSVT
jgi:hypothetical protein